MEILLDYVLYTLSANPNLKGLVKISVEEAENLIQCFGPVWTELTASSCLSGETNKK